MLKALKFAVLVFIVAGLAYPLAMTGLGQLMFPVQANGSIIKAPDGTPLGSALLGQPFSRAEYFHPRPSFNQYDGANSGGANLGPTSRKLVERVAQAAGDFRQTNHWSQAIPIDAVTTSGSGLDPHITLANALAQSDRVAAARGINPQAVRAEVMKRSENTLSQAPFVNVLKLNLALDALNRNHDHKGETTRAKD